MNELMIYVFASNSYQPLLFLICLMSPILLIVMSWTSKDKSNLYQQKFISFDYIDPTMNAYGDDDDEW